MTRPLFAILLEAARDARVNGRRLTPAERLVLVYLGLKQGSNDDCWPSLATITADVGLDKVTVIRATEVLAKVGLLNKTPGSPGRGHSSRYSVTLPNRLTGATISDDAKGSDSQPIKPEKGSAAQPIDAEKRLNPATEKVAPVNMRQSRDDQSREEKKDSLSDHAVRLSRVMLDLILSRKPDLRRPDLTTWTRDIDRMIRLDHRTPERVEAVMRWSQRDPFWSSIVLSPKKLRDKFDQLELKMRGTHHDTRPRADRDYADRESDIGSTITV